MTLLRTLKRHRCFGARQNLSDSATDIIWIPCRRWSNRVLYQLLVSNLAGTVQINLLADPLIKHRHLPLITWHHCCLGLLLPLTQSYGSDDALDYLLKPALFSHWDHRVISPALWRILTLSAGAFNCRALLLLQGRWMWKLSGLLLLDVDLL